MKTYAEMSREDAAEIAFAFALMGSVLEADSYVRRPAVQRTVADKIRRPIARADFGPAGEPGDTHFREFVQARSPLSENWMRVAPGTDAAIWRPWSRETGEL